MKPWPWQNQEPVDFGEVDKPVWPCGENPDKPKPYGGGGGGGDYNMALFTAMTFLGAPVLIRR